MSKRIVVDTSVVVSALIGKRGASREIIRRCLAGEYKPLISNALLNEYEDVTARDRILKECPLSEHEIRTLLNAFYSTCKWVPIYYLWRPNLTDEADNFLVELALAANAHTIVTNNIKDLQNTELTFKELKVLTPNQLLKGE